MTRKPNPFEEIEQLLERMSEQFQDSDRLSHIEAALPGRTSVDVAEFDDAFEVTMDLPGFETEDIDVELLDDQLRIQAETESETETEEPDRYLRRERRQHSVDRRVRIPGPVAEDEVEATFVNGVLTVRLPKSDTAEESHTIDIE